MSIQSRIMHFVVGVMCERPVRGISADALLALFRASQLPFSTALQHKADTAANRTLVAHIIGIERWAQARLDQMHSGVPHQAESNAYIPTTDVSYAELVTLADTTRTASIALLNSVVTANLPLTQHVMHTDIGSLSVAGWIQYMMTHSMHEAKKLR